MYVFHYFSLKPNHENFWWFYIQEYKPWSDCVCRWRAVCLFQWRISDGTQPAFFRNLHRCFRWVRKTSPPTLCLPKDLSNMGSSSFWGKRLITEFTYIHKSSKQNFFRPFFFFKILFKTVECVGNKQLLINVVPSRKEGTKSYYFTHRHTCRQEIYDGENTVFGLTRGNPFLHFF